MAPSPDRCDALDTSHHQTAVDYCLMISAVKDMKAMTEPEHVGDILRRQALVVLDELFVEIHHLMLDPEDPMFRTLESISAADASREIGLGARCLAAQVEHTAFYIDTLLADDEDADWGAAWAIRTVNDAEWKALKLRLQTSYDALRRAIESQSTWDEGAITNLLSQIGHAGYHLGQIREALAVLRSTRESQ